MTRFSLRCVVWAVRIAERGTLAALLSGGLVLFAGCGAEADPLNRQAVSGTVTLDGQPIKQGAISFSPAGGVASSSETVGGGAAIVDGSYELPAEQGLPPGKYTVHINASDQPPTDPNEPPGDVKPAKELVPASWNSKSEHEVEVADGGDNSFPFDIKSAD